MTHGGGCRLRTRRPYDLYLYPETPTCVVNVLRGQPDALELRTIFRKHRDASIVGARRAHVAITGAHCNRLRSNVTALHARSKRLCVARTSAGAVMPTMYVVTAPATVSIESEDLTYTCEEYPVVVLRENKWMPCMVIDAALAPKKSELLTDARDVQLVAQLRAHTPPESTNMPVAVIQMRDGRITRAWEYTRSDDTCTARSAVVYSPAAPCAIK